MDSSRNAVLMARELGVKIAAGYDAGSAVEQGHNVRELLTLNNYGLSPLEVIRAATTSAAELLGWEDRVGSVEPGKFADLIAVGGDPLTDIGELDRIEFVMKAGAVVKDDVHRR
jgi:imidazolonepropionase-like amidohydrolase